MMTPRVQNLLIEEAAAWRDTHSDIKGLVGMCLFLISAISQKNKVFAIAFGAASILIIIFIINDVRQAIRIRRQVNEEQRLAQFIQI